MTVTSSRFLVGLLLAAFVAVCILFAPYLAVFVTAIVFGAFFHPVNRRLRRTYGSTGAALITVALVVLVIIALVTFVGVQVVREAGQILAGLESGQIVPTAMIAVIQAKITALIPSAHIDVLASFKAALSWFLQQAGSIFRSVASVILNLFLSVIALFYWFKDSDKFRLAALEVIPLSREDAEGILGRLSLFVHSLIKGTLAVAVIQGISAGIGFLIFGVPNAVLWASVTVMCALVPTLGTSIIFIPVVAYLAFTGHTVSAIGVGLWGLCAVGLIDNLLGPRLMSRGSNMHPFFTLMAVLGGVHLFGPIGVFAGPLIVSLFFAVCKTYSSSQAKVS